MLLTLLASALKDRMIDGGKRGGRRGRDREGESVSVAQDYFY